MASIMAFSPRSLPWLSCHEKEVLCVIIVQYVCVFPSAVNLVDVFESEAFVFMVFEL